PAIASIASSPGSLDAHAGERRGRRSLARDVADRTERRGQRRAASATSPDDGHDHEVLPDWQVPAGWQQQAAPQFAVAAFAIPGAEGAGAEVSVSHMGGTGGGALLNVNRWRGQIGLPPASPDEIVASALSVKVGSLESQRFVMTSTDGKKSVDAVMTSKDGATWFFKMNGETAAVEVNAPAFVAFLSASQLP
ncbi:MAG: hypothetical protein D4R66_01220, partial [Opitutales bacterium]